MAAHKTISQQLDQVFQQASTAYMKKLLKFDRDQAEFAAIELDAQEKKLELTRLYREEYGARVNAVRQRLYDEAAQVHLNHPAPSGVITNTQDEITREARREVDLAHENDLQKVWSEAEQSFEDLLERAQRRNQTKGLATADFLRARDRRSGEDRRTIQHSHD